MADITTKLEVFGELMQGTLGIGIWHYGPSMNLLKTNSPCRKTYDNLFAISGCKDRILKACKSSHMPHMVMDAMGLAWIAVSCLEKGDDPNALIVLGPVFSSGYSEANLDKAIGDVQISYSLKRELINQIMLVPVVQLLTFCEYGAMLYYCLSMGKE